MYSLDTSPSGRRRPSVGHRYQPPGSTFGAHDSIAATAASLEEYQYP
jgi:hypothetical protein